MVRKVPRGRGFDKRSIARHLKALEAFDDGTTIPQYARKEKLNADFFVIAAETHFPQQWQKIIREKPPKESTCAYCERPFIPNRAGQRYHSRECSEHARADEQYFGGKRREAVGMLDGVCQLCGQSPKKGLQAHHLIGKERDPDNEHLVGLCAGCHQLVTIASRPAFLRELEGWEKLRRLVEIRVTGVVD